MTLGTPLPFLGSPWTPSMTPGTLTLTPRTSLDPHAKPPGVLHPSLDPQPWVPRTSKGLVGEGGWTFWSLRWLRDDHGHRVPWNPGIT